MDVKTDITPIRQQYLQVKQAYPGAIVLFRLGDFYETFDEDAYIASRVLEIVLTAREMGKGQHIPMAGIPYHALDSYLARLVNHGYKVAICEQTTRPGEGKGLVQREVVRLVTPGTVVEPGLLDSRSNNYLVSLSLGDSIAGIAFTDITTGEFAATQLPLSRLETELQRLGPAEVIAAEGADLTGHHIAAPVTRTEPRWHEPDTARQSLLTHFGVTTLDGFGCSNMPLAIAAAGALIHYLEETRKGTPGQLHNLSTYSTDSFMALDRQTQRNLEIFQSASGEKSGSLLSVLDLTRTPMGGRLLKRWLGQPLLEVAGLHRRQEAISAFIEDTLMRTRIIAVLGETADLERLINRIKGGIAAPRELIALCHSLEKIPDILRLTGTAGKLAEISRELKPCPETVELILKALEDSPVSLDEGGVIKSGFSEELDKLRESSSNARRYLADLERSERDKTGIKSLRVGYNRVFGYYIEISNANLAQVPPEYIRKQTLTNGERFFTPELKEYESLILNAQERIVEIEGQLFRQVCTQVGAAANRILETAGVLAHIDVVSSLAEAAVRYGYVRPALNDGNAVHISQGRHIMAERNLDPGVFVPNDTSLSNDDDQLIILTGPNMSGKSTYLRQVALIVLMAQIGSYVPAAAATIGLVDRIFTRIGARDDLATGQSTFMVEMVETANILNNATPRSLLILDEIGRGTSTYDGLSIARAVAEYIHSATRLGAKTLFATHYHELVELAGYLPRVRNFNVAVSETGGEVTFLYKIVPGGVDQSYGIHVAKLAGLPKSVLHRAREVLDDLEGDSRKNLARHSLQGKRRGKDTAPQQMPLMGQKAPLIEELGKLEIDAMTPLEALNKLYELRKKVQEG
jgi:DNA mismatch repair protein MutS